ncbi:iron ABC transporter permease [Corynebacterium sp. SA-MJD20WY100]|uniref:FecCD family ABC transporter permease n=1 Tax=Corynebacterium sp. SA-MJD20WY100 TaxID=3142969 RepID=UPI0032214782
MTHQMPRLPETTESPNRPRPHPSTDSGPDSGTRTHARRASLVLAGTLLALVLAVVASVMFGVRVIGVADALAALQGHADTAAQAAAYVRVPRTVLAVLVGASLAVAGTIFQGVTRNPLADPGIFGVLAGASLAVVTGITFFGLARPLSTMAVAIVGSFLAATFVYAVGSLGRGGATPLKLALAGAATAAAISSLVSAIVLPRADVMDTFRFWQIGSVGGAQWPHLAAAAPLLLLGAGIAAYCAHGLNALALGDSLASGLGFHAARTRLLATIGAVILCGCATALAGPIAFIGLIVPHLMRVLVGTDHRVLLPACALGGAVVLTVADTVGRLIARPEELAVGILTPFLGAPLFIWIIRRTKIRELA